MFRQCVTLAVLGCVMAAPQHQYQTQPQVSILTHFKSNDCLNKEFAEKKMNRKKHFIFY